MSDFPPSDLPSFPDSTEPGAGEFLDIWDDSTQEESVLPPMDVDIMDEIPREIGYSEELSEFWHYQGDTQDCALYSQGGVLEADGQLFDVVKYEQQGIEGGWYVPGEGTYMDHFGDLLEENGAAVTRYESATIQDMANELDRGHGVVVAVDCLPIWGEPGGHALWITGIEVGSNGTPTSVICNDSGREDGQQIAYPYEAFKLAWDSYGDTIVATKDQLSALS